MQIIRYVVYVEYNAFYVVSEKEVIPSKTHAITFANEIINHNSTFTASTNGVFISQTGLYWFHLSAGIPNYTEAYFRLNGVSVPAMIYKNNTAFAFDQSTFDSLQWVKNMSQLSISTNYNLYSSINREVAWLGFRIDSIMSPLIAFSAFRNAVQYNNQTYSDIKIIYDHVTLNEGKCLAC